jgi:predicted esterase YcpF (UPF0227 family)
MRFIYLHGFASAPVSAKAVYLNNCFTNLAISLEVPDLNQGDFSHLTITRQINQVEKMFTFQGELVTVIGSSLGGLTSAHLAQSYQQIERIVLLAPAFCFLNHWLAKLQKEQLNQWKESGYLPIYHYHEQQSLPLHYKFVEDALLYQETQLFRPVPTLILHGQSDEVIPIEASRDYASIRPWVQLIELDSDHSLIDVMPKIWDAIKTFCQLS